MELNPLPAAGSGCETSPVSPAITHAALGNLSQDCCGFLKQAEKEDSCVLFVCSSCSLPFAVTDLAKLLPVRILVAIIQVRNSQKRKIFIFIFFGVFSKN